MMKKFASVDSYIAALPLERGRKLAELRSIVKQAAPAATEGISYRMPMYRLNGKMILGFAAFKNHIGFYAMTANFLDAFRDELKEYGTSTGTIRFPWDKPLPRSLIQRLVKQRVALHEANMRR